VEMLSGPLELLFLRVSRVVIIFLREKKEVCSSSKGNFCDRYGVWEGVG